jgi:hypothetical protein
MSANIDIWSRGWVPLPRAALDIIGDDAIARAVYIELARRARYTAGRERIPGGGVRYVDIEVGQAVCGRGDLADRLHVSVRVIRSALDRLSAWRLIDRLPTHTGSVVTLCGFAEFWRGDVDGTGVQRPSDRPTDRPSDRPTAVPSDRPTDRPLTDTEETEETEETDDTHDARACESLDRIRARWDEIYGYRYGSGYSWSLRDTERMAQVLEVAGGDDEHVRRLIDAALSRPLSTLPKHLRESIDGYAGTRWTVARFTGMWNDLQDWKPYPCLACNHELADGGPDGCCPRCRRARAEGAA